MIPRMLKQMLRSQHGNRRLLSNQLGRLQGCSEDLVAAALHDTRHKTHFLCLGRGKVAACEGELTDEALITGDLGCPRERADVSRKANVNFLVSQSQTHSSATSGINVSAP